MGGAELDMWVLAHLLKDSYEVKIITADWGQDDVVEVGEGIKLHKVFKIERSWWAYLRAPFLLWDALRKMNADIYITSSASPEVGLIAFFAKLYGKTFVYRTAHDIDCDGTYRKNNGIRGWLYQYGLLNASVVAVSVNTHKELLQKYYPGFDLRISFIPLGLELEIVEVIEKKGYVLWIARCEEWKQPELFLQLAAELPEYSFVMISPKQKQNEDFFEVIKKQAGTISNLQFFDYVPFRDIQPYFERAKVFVNTSRTEGFTYTLIQSGLARTPVVYLNVDPDGVIADNNIGYFSQNDFLHMKNQVRFLMEDSDDWHQKSSNIGRYVTQAHGAHVLKPRWLELLSSI